MKPDPPSTTSRQLAEIQDAMITATELQQVYLGLTQHPRVRATPGSNDVFEACQGQISQDIATLGQQVLGLSGLVQTLPVCADDADFPANGDSLMAPPPQLAALPDFEPLDPERSIVESVRKVFHLEDLLRQQLAFSLQSAKARRHLKLELQLRMILLSAEQRCTLLEDRYRFARSGRLLFQGLRKQTTRFLSQLQGERRRDLD